MGLFDEFVSGLIGPSIQQASAHAMAAGVEITCRHLDQIVFDMNLNDSEKLMMIRVMSTDLQEQAAEWKENGEVKPADESRTQKQIKTLEDLTETMIMARRMDLDNG